LTIDELIEKVYEQTTRSAD